LAGSTLLGFDNKKKSFIKKEITYDEMLNHQTILGKKSLYQDISESRTNYINLNENSEKKLKTLYENK